jgi:copper chaperone
VGVFDEPAEHDMNDTTIAIDGMSCGHCVMSVKKALSALPGVEIKDVKVGSAELRFDPAVVSRETILAAIAKAGFQPRAS